MNRLLSTTLLLLMLATAFAAPVSKQKTARIAQAYFFERGGRDTLVETQTQFQNLRIYVGSKGYGFVIMSSDDAAMPFLAYSVTNPFSAVNMPENVASWLQHYDDEIASIQQNDIEATTAVSSEWKYANRLNVSRGHRMPALSAKKTDNLLTTTWNQDTYYNQMCPYDNKRAKLTYTGCTATAMAQIMRYWRHPLNGMGSTSYTDSLGVHSANFSDGNYDWSNMPDSLYAGSTSTQVNAVAKLMYHVGVAVHMNYSVYGSNASGIGQDTIGFASSENAYREYFKYLHTVHSVSLADYTIAQWNALLKNEIDNGRPVQYTGFEYKSTGHSFVCCGYDNTGKFYFNWGWGGADDGNYLIGSLNTNNGTFNWHNDAVVGIQPDTTNAATTVVALTRNIANAGTESGAGTYTSYQDTVHLLATPTKGYLFDNWDGSNNYCRYNFIANGGNITHKANYSPIQGDTLGYCFHGNHSSTDYEGHQYRWAIRIDTAYLRSNRQLECVRYYAYTAGQYIVSIYQGGDTMPLTKLSSDTFAVNTKEEWRSLYLSTPLQFNKSLPIWIVMESIKTDFSMSFSYYRGIIDGAWFEYEGRWFNYINYFHKPLAWQIEGVFSPIGGPYTITVQPNNPEWGTVSGGGKYNNNDVATLTATPNSNCVFVQWSDGVTTPTRTVTVTRDAGYEAIFRSLTAVDDISESQFVVVADDDEIIVSGAEGETIRIYNAQGKLVAERVNASDAERFGVSSGIYFVNINKTTSKVIVK